MYKLVNVNNPKLAIATNKDIAPLFQMLDNAELKYKAPVIINEAREIIAGHESAWGWSVHKNFQL